VVLTPSPSKSAKVFKGRTLGPDLDLFRVHHFGCSHFFLGFWVVGGAALPTPRSGACPALGRFRLPKGGCPSSKPLAVRLRGAPLGMG
jgi:hypothetical protein